jgi:hypothetical protein
MLYRCRNFCPYGPDLEAPVETMGAFFFAYAGNGRSHLTKAPKDTQMMLWLAWGA